MTFDESLELSLEQNSGLGKPKGVCSCGRVAVRRRWAQWQGDRDSGEGEDGARPGAPCMRTLSSVFLTLESRGGAVLPGWFAGAVRGALQVVLCGRFSKGELSDSSGMQWGSQVRPSQSWPIGAPALPSLA